MCSQWILSGFYPDLTIFLSSNTQKYSFNSSSPASLSEKQERMTETECSMNLHCLMTNKITKAKKTKQQFFYFVSDSEIRKKQQTFCLTSELKRFLGLQNQSEFKIIKVKYIKWKWPRLYIHLISKWLRPRIISNRLFVRGDAPFKSTLNTTIHTWHFAPIFHELRSKYVKIYLYKL